MERFLDEQDSPSPSPSIHSLLSGDPKRQSRTSPSSTASDSVDQISSEEARIINSRLEDIARHLDRESLESLVRLAASTSPSIKSPNGISSTQNQHIDSISINSTRSHSSEHFYNNTTSFSQ